MPSYGDIVFFRDSNNQWQRGYLRAIHCFKNTIDVNFSGGNIELPYWMYREKEDRGSERPGAWHWEDGENVKPCMDSMVRPQPDPSST